MTENDYKVIMIRITKMISTTIAIVMAIVLNLLAMEIGGQDDLLCLIAF